jgi:hypothetical protein
METARIYCRFEPCRCGCGGTDPWHRTYYRRKVRQTGECEGWVRLPFSRSPVRVLRDLYVWKGRVTLGVWIADRDSIDPR